MSREIIITYPKFAGHGGTETVLVGLLNEWKEKENIQLFLPGGSENEAWLGEIVDRRDKVVLHHKKWLLTQFWDTFKYVLSRM